MNYHRLYIDGFIDPKWWREVQSRSFEVTALPDGKVVLNGQSLSNCPYIEGTDLYVRVNREVECVSLEEYKVFHQEVTRRREEKEKAYKDRLDQYRETASEFYSSYNIPFEYSAAITGHLHGLTERSAGNGVTRATVIHLMAHQDFIEGKFKRRAKDKVCLSTGKNYSDQDNASHYNIDGSNLPYIPKITCKKCLEIMERWKSNTISST